jgi:hypothetical protein
MVLKNGSSATAARIISEVMVTPETGGDATSPFKLLTAYIRGEADIRPYGCLVIYPLHHFLSYKPHQGFENIVSCHRLLIPTGGTPANITQGLLKNPVYPYTRPIPPLLLPPYSWPGAVSPGQKDPEPAACGGVIHSFQRQEHRGLL